MILFRLRDVVDKVVREEQCGFRKGGGEGKGRKGGGYVDQIFTCRLIIEKCLTCQTPLVLSCIDYEQAFDSSDRRYLANVLSLCGKPGNPCMVYQTNTLK